MSQKTVIITFPVDELVFTFFVLEFTFIHCFYCYFV